MQKTKKMNIKVRDLKPKKDAKGGNMYRLSSRTGSQAGVKLSGQTSVQH